MSRQADGELRPGPEGQAVLPLVLQKGLLPVLQGSQTLKSIVTPHHTPLQPLAHLPGHKALVPGVALRSYWC